MFRKKTKELNPNSWAFASGGYCNYYLSTLVLVMGVIGVAVMSSAAVTEGLGIMIKQMIFLAVGIVVMFIASKIDYVFFFKKIFEKKFLNKFTFDWLIYAAGIGLLLICFVQNHDREIKRYLSLPFFSIEPSEILKFAIILTIPFYSYRHTDDLKKEGLTPPEKIPGCGKLNAFFRHRGMHLNNTLFKKYTRIENDQRIVFFDDSFYYHFVLGLHAVMPIGLIFISSHLSATLICTLVAIFLLLNCDIKRKYLIAAAIPAFIAVLGVAAYKLKDYQADRINSFHLNPTDEQTRAAVYAICGGGFFGKGYLYSAEKHGFVPEKQNDFIYSIFCEEFGMAGAIVLIIAFTVLIYFIYKTGKNANKSYATLSVQGIAVMFALQVAFHIGVNTSLLPNTGITLPFFSSGGSALLLAFAEMGYVLSVSCGTRYLKDSDVPGRIFVTTEEANRYRT